ncbi:putative cofD-like protein [Breznakia sp. PF5-3]|uniref:gluconeogenesis factor YvcK family protein n=1 Tax=unclassified Breznakia TaxID=2623764 RepID=UPI0024056D9F|nr:MULTISPECIES: uridine diphosphate-N-acetylglucosamine-binding protein YvcK [unclassified Breznakia]MDF9825217.1 putative cofD-like protein [Breznakia sp. PM6-1]MDF9836098.1 putative cofD-like protein [Breznakia sp. PF5-3]MDF9838738.1 putative cofD-like protein [Breznakia sp. PFB2-8]MDF9860774.1 putative cofD-like protein [Breznakia sp. PH5-24]
MKKVVVIGGGTGQSVILRGLKNIPDIKLSTIVTVADDGGSTGRLRENYRMPAMGDIRNVMVALAESETLLSSLMDYRFEGSGDVAGHNLGNLLLTALTQISGNFLEAIQTFSRVLRVKGEIIPSTTQIVNLIAVMEDGTKVKGESNIPKFHNRIEKVYYQERVYATRRAISAIESADYIIFGIGSLYTSIMPNIIIPEINQALKKSKSKKIYFCNVMSQPGETDHFTLEDHVTAIEKHSYKGIIDVVVTHNNILYSEVLENYRKEDSYPIWIADKEHAYKLVKKDLLKFDDDLIRHDSEKVKSAFEELLEVKE